MKVYRPSVLGDYEEGSRLKTEREKNLRKASTPVSVRDLRGVKRARKVLLEKGYTDAEKIATEAKTSRYNVMRATFGHGMGYEYCEGCERMVHMPCVACNANRCLEQGGKVDLKDGEDDVDRDDPEFTEEAFEARKQEVRSGLLRRTA